MKKLIILSLIFTLPNSFFANNCYDDCANSYWNQVDQTVENYRNELGNIVWDAVETVASYWASHLAGKSYPGPLDGSANSYWNAVSTQEIYEGLLDWHMATFNSCANNCG